MTRGALLLMLISVALITSPGQSKDDLSSKYRPMNAYLVRPGILMLVQFDREGQACEMTLEQTSGLWHGSEEVTPLTNEIAHKLLDELAPVSLRGVKGEYLNPDSIMAGQSYFLKQD